MGYSCTIQQEQDAIQALEDNGYGVTSESIGAYLNGDSLFFQEVDYENDAAWRSENGFSVIEFSDWQDMISSMEGDSDGFLS